jgi:hypothetical protein
MMVTPVSIEAGITVPDRGRRDGDASHGRCSHREQDSPYTTLT